MPALAIALVLFVFSLLLVDGRWWGVWGLQHMRPYFLDLVAVLAAGEAHVRGIDVFSSNPLDPLGRPHVYGPAWLLTGQLGLTRADAWWLGVLLAVGFVVVACVLIAPRSRAALLWTVLALLSPSVLLGLERGNNDLVVFLLLALAAACVAWRSRLGSVVAMAVVVVAAALKFYPLAGLAVILARRAALKLALALVLIGILAFVALALLQQAQIARVFAVTPKPVTIFAYGASVTHATWTLLGAVRGWLVLGAGPVLGLGAWWLWRHHRELATFVPREGLAAAAFLAGAATWLGCFVVTSSYPYRAVLVLLAFPALLAADAPRCARQLAGAFVVCFWLGSPKDFFATAAEADPANERALQLLSVLMGVEQALVFVATVGVGWVAAGWAWRRWRGERQGVALETSGPLSAN